MKHKLFVTFLILVLATFCLSAQAIRESKDEPVKFSSLDLETASFQKVIEVFEAETQSYEIKCEAIYSKMAEAYSEGNADDYFDAKGDANKGEVATWEVTKFTTSPTWPVE